MKIRIYISVTACLLLLCSQSRSQSLRGMYINDFDQILGDAQKEDSVLNYFQDSTFNYLALYDLSSLNYNDPAEMNILSSFILKARQQYSIPYVGAVGETVSFFTDHIKKYNNSRSNIDEKINVFNVEFEFWTNASVEPGGYYCVKYLQAAGCDCDTAGAFAYYLRMLRSVDSLAATQGAISETYVGWFNQGQGKQIQGKVDRILLHAYREDNSSVWGYSKTRLGYLASNNQVVNVAPIFSAEPVFMGPWLQQHSLMEAYDRYQQDFAADNSSWKPFVNLLGFQWFCWSYMPKQNTGGCALSIPAGGFTDNITAATATLHWDPIASADSIVIRYTAEQSGATGFIKLPYTGQVSQQLTGLVPSTNYSWRIRTICGNASGTYSDKIYFNTHPATGLETFENNPSDVIVYPNPATTAIHLAVTCNQYETALMRLTDLTGKIILSKEIKRYPGAEIQQDVAELSRGVYFLSINSNTTAIIKRISIE